MRPSKPPRPTPQPRLALQPIRPRMRSRNRIIKCQSPIPEYREIRKRLPGRFAVVIGAFIPDDGKEHDESIETDESAPEEKSPGREEPRCAKTGY